MIRPSTARLAWLVLLPALLLGGCFNTVTRMAGGEDYAGTVKDGLYYPICRTADGQGKVRRDGGLRLEARRLPDGRAGLAMEADGVMLAEVRSLRRGGGRAVWLVSYQETGRTTWDSFVVVTADGSDRAFAALMVPNAVEELLMAADKTGDADAMRAILGEAVDAGDYRMAAAYVAADLVAAGADGPTPLPAALQPVAAAVGKPMVECD